jgi:hypothetical protein
MPGGTCRQERCRTQIRITGALRLARCGIQPARGRFAGQDEYSCRGRRAGMPLGKMRIECAGAKF